MLIHDQTPAQPSVPPRYTAGAAMREPFITLPAVWRRKHLGLAEQKVVELAAAGLPTKEIAARLGKSTLTARNQLIRSMRKIGVRNRYELMARLRPLTAPITLPEHEFVYMI